MDDQAAKAAGTARFIARCLLVASWEPRYAALCPAGVGERCRRLLMASGDRAFVRAAGSRYFRSVFHAMVDFLLPGIVAHYLARKRCLEDWLRNTPCRQVVVLAAGLDTLAWRLCGELPDIHFVEVDRPAGLRIKTLALSQDAPPNLTFLAADLASESPARILEQDRAFDPDAPTLFIVEGLSMYLPPARVRSLLKEIAAPGGSRVLACTFMEKRADGRIRFRRSHWLVGWWLRWQGEPFRWSLAPDGSAAFLAECGWHARELASAEILRDHYLTPAGLRDAPLAAGEWLTLAGNSST